jgi:hypothetical protein
MGHLHPHATIFLVVPPPAPPVKPSVAAVAAVGSMPSMPIPAPVSTPTPFLGYPSIPVSAPFALPPLDASAMYMNMPPPPFLPTPAFKPAPPNLPYPSMPTMPAIPSMPAVSAAAPSAPKETKALDPNNDVSLWSEHKSEVGRVYWYNSVSRVSTYEKPFCLKTHEERAVPPCPWKEYHSDGRVYYSNGKESRSVNRQCHQFIFLFSYSIYLAG